MKIRITFDLTDVQLAAIRYSLGTIAGGTPSIKEVADWISAAVAVDLDTVQITYENDPYDGRDEVDHGYCERCGEWLVCAEERRGYLCAPCGESLDAAGI